MTKSNKRLISKRVRAWLTNGDIIEGDSLTIGNTIRYWMVFGINIILIESLDGNNNGRLPLLIDNRTKYLNADNSIKDQYYVRW